MTTLLLADVGNTRTKVAVAGSPPRVVVRDAAHDPAGWVDALAAAAGPGPWRWAVGGANPPRVDALRAWVAGRGEACAVVRHHSHVPLTIRGPDPDSVGVDRLLDCFGANARRRPGAAAVVADAGTAVVVNVLDADGVLVGGAIMPGYATMLAALHAKTARLPRVEPGERRPHFPGLNTADAMRAGCFHAAAGGLSALVREAVATLGGGCDVFLTGGDAARLAEALAWCDDLQVVDTLTLEGLQLASDFRG